MHDTEATMITSSRSSSARVAEWRIRSICSLIELLLDVGVGARHVGLGLVVVVVGDEILDRVVREEELELAVELRGQRLVGRQDEAGRWVASITWAMVKVLPEPVTPSSTWSQRIDRAAGVRHLLRRIVVHGSLPDRDMLMASAQPSRVGEGQRPAMFGLALFKSLTKRYGGDRHLHNLEVN
jgi:hypothetical protein